MREKTYGKSESQESRNGHIQERKKVKQLLRKPSQMSMVVYLKYINTYEVLKECGNR